MKKCSLRGLEGRSDLHFYTYPRDRVALPGNTLLLDLEAPPLTVEDGEKTLFIVDGTWRYAKKMVENTPGLAACERRSIPSRYKTAYPRRQEDCPDPERGLASVEALYIAYLMMGRDVAGLLDHYHWKEQFLSMNGL